MNHYPAYAFYLSFSLLFDMFTTLVVNFHHFLIPEMLLVLKKRRFPCQHLSQQLTWQVILLLFLEQLHPQPQLVHPWGYSWILWMNWGKLQKIKEKAMKTVVVTTVCLRIQALSTMPQNQNPCLHQSNPETQALSKALLKEALSNNLLLRTMKIYFPSHNLPDIQMSMLTLLQKNTVGMV
jgi:hypothetical protein